MPTGDFNYNLYNTTISTTGTSSPLPTGLMIPTTTAAHTHTTWTQLNPPYLFTKGAAFINGRLYIDGDQILRFI